MQIGGRSLPVELAVVIGMLFLSALLLLIPSLDALPDSVGLLDEGSLGRAIGLLLLMAITILLACAAACVGLGVMLLHGDRAGRILTVALCAALALGMLDVDDKGSDEIVVLLCSIAAIAILTLSPNVRDFFTGPLARQTAQPPSIAAARALIVVLGWALGLIGLLYLLVGNLDGKYYFVGLGLIGVSIALQVTSRQIRRPDPNGRNLATGLMAGYALLLLVANGDASSALVPLALVIAVIVLLWAPTDAREYFSS